jgi:hypothetical protein
MIARRYPVVFVPTNKSLAQGGLPFHSAQFFPLRRGQPRGVTAPIAICPSCSGTHRLVAGLKLPGCSRGVRPARTSSTICRRNAGANCGRVLGIVAPFQSATCLRNWVNFSRTGSWSVYRGRSCTSTGRWRSGAGTSPAAVNCGCPSMGSCVQRANNTPTRATARTGARRPRSSGGHRACGGKGGLECQQ